MENHWGKNYHFEIFGGSHEKTLGVRLDLPLGSPVNTEQVAKKLARRRPGYPWSSGRQETDEVHWIGLKNNRVVQRPLVAEIENRDSRSTDYDFYPKFRPGHGDYPAYVKYGKFFPGGGMFSGRMTALLVIAGAIAEEYLKEQGIQIVGQLLQMGDLRSLSFGEKAPADDEIERLQSPFPVRNEGIKEKMLAEIQHLQQEKNSVGGIVEVAAYGLEPGIGELFFGSLESTIASLAFSVPAVKGMEFGDGFALAAMTGEEAKDEYLIKDGKICTATNHNGGILAGMSTGMPLIFRTVFKPTASIGRPQRTVDPEGKPGILELQGRHDPCIAPRAVPVMESVLAIALWDRLLEGKGNRWIR